MTRLYVMRHGDAESAARTDSERPLSERGKAEAASMVQYLIAEPPVNLLVSPYLRAQQTAAIVLSGLEKNGFKPDVQTIPNITPDDNPREIIAKLSDMSDGPLMIVSHNPFVSLLVSLLTQGHTQVGMAMATASIACVTADVWELGAADLHWYNTPSI